MIMHISIPAKDPRTTAELFAKLIDGVAMPFPVAPGGWVAIARNGSGVGVEVMAEDTAYHPGEGDPLPGHKADGPYVMPWETQLRRDAQAQPASPMHTAIATKLTEAEVIALGREQGWRAVPCDRGGVFGLVELWVDNRFLVEVLPPEQMDRYLAFYNPAVAGKMFGAVPA